MLQGVAPPPYTNYSRVFTFHLIFLFFLEFY